MKEFSTTCEKQTKYYEKKVTLEEQTVDPFLFTTAT